MQNITEAVLAAHEAAMQAVEDQEQADILAAEKAKQAAILLATNLANQAAEQAIDAAKQQKLDKIARLCAELQNKILCSCIYHEAPDDIMEHIISMFSDCDEWGGNGGMNALRLVSKRLMHAVEACATRLTNEKRDDGLESLPITLLKRCKRIEHITCDSRLSSLEGCPAGLKSLWIRSGALLQSLEPFSVCIGLENLFISSDATCIFDLSPLATCTRLKKLTISGSIVTDISFLASMPLL